MWREDLYLSFILNKMLQFVYMSVMILKENALEPNVAIVTNATSTRETARFYLSKFAL